MTKLARALPVFAAVLAFGSAAPASAETLVEVKITNVANNIANDLDVNVSQIPITVQAPLSLAANVCNVDAAVLAQQASSGDAQCTAESTSGAFNDIVQQQINEQGGQPGRGRK